MKFSKTFTTLVFIINIFPFTITSFPHFFPNVSSIPPSFLPNKTGAWDSFSKLSGCHPGQTVPGIDKVKNYFRYFGYIQNISEAKNFTDEFDTTLESAVKNYQQNFNLNTTGQLDESTVKQMLKPRCGVADIVNGSSTMNSGKAASINGTVAHYSFFPGRPRWSPRRNDLTYAFDPRNQLSDEVKRVFASAFTRWSEWTPLTFTESSGYDSADLKIGFYAGDHGDGEEFDGLLGTLAHAFAPPRGLLHLDSDETWIIDDVLASGSSSAMDLESVAVHEIGHLLGLGHSSVEEAIMFPTISSGIRKVELAQDDVEGIQVLYGTNPDANNTNGPAFTLGDRDASWAHQRVSVTAQIIFLAFGLFTLFVL